MATFDIAGLYPGTFNQATGVFRITEAFIPFAYSYSDANGSVVGGDQLVGDANDGVGPFTDTYVGSVNGHWVVYNETDGYALATTTANPYPGGITAVVDQTTPFIFCFAAGTAIATPGGEVAVEALSPGDLVLTDDGRAVAVTFVGRQTLAAFFLPEERSLVRVAAGALGDGLPKRDLVLTGDHALLLEGVLVNAGALVNGTTIARVARAELPDRFTVYHVETAAHDVILAEGVPAETFMDAKGRERFDNHADYVPPPGAARKIEHAAPRVTAPRQVPARVLARIAASPDGRALAA
ncbi:Hint domain-containing protein [Falsiroseomonas stagni]|uniref:Hint domain-containing protein n=1 Tax=Falsiroseomonas stagni DSM 19981 TaxID=1123062 RepID=A0A1I4BAC6_9PROT|nr:Hint domain-containing protein [Falsiroseomonas stagni]SFK65758.1 Hint domain-containing protein [Falsiroseomonas stagni DSM 19981]